MAARFRAARGAALALVVLAGSAGAAHSQSAQHVLVIANQQSEVSERVATYYATRRGVPDDQILRLSIPPGEEISRDLYATAIEGPIGQWLITRAAQDRILYLVLAKGMPLRIRGTGGPSGTIASVDSELALLYRRMAGAQIALTGPVENPYFAGAGGLKNALPFSHRTHDIYLVSRLDGYTFEDVRALIDRGLAPTTEGVVLLDGRAELLPSPGNQWLASAAEALRAIDGWNARVRHDSSGEVLRDEPHVLGYYSWGSNDRTEGTRHPGHQFNPGALAALFVSTDARTFEEPPEGWVVNNRPFRGSHQSLVADLIRDGITGVAGHVAEPYLNATIRPDILFPAYVAGFNLVEAFYLALPSLSWQTIVVGDPLCAPFRTANLADDSLGPPIDSTTEMPAFLAARRVAALVGAGVREDAARLMARTEVRRAHGDREGMRGALEQAVNADPSFVDGRMALATLLEAEEEWAAAVEQYRHVVARVPEHADALNNLAYALATRTGEPGQALPFAVRAFKASNANPAMADTLAWVYHLLGQNLEAEPLIVAAANTAPRNAVIHRHAAAILAARGKTELARRSLERALQIDPTLAEHADVQAIRSELDGVQP